MFIAVATLLLRIPLLQLAGGLLLVWIAVKLLRQPAAVHGDTREGASLSDAIWTIIVADAAMSLDNVVAVAGAAGGDFRLLLFGIGLSLPLVVWGSGLLARLMDRFPAIIWVGGGILGYVAGEMILRDLAVERWLGGAPGPVQLLPIGLGVLLALLGWGWSGRVTAENRDRA
jgi:YjbE family integral membrane protein